MLGDDLHGVTPKRDGGLEIYVSYCNSAGILLIQVTI